MKSETVARIGHPFIMQSALFTDSLVADGVLAPDERVFRNTTPYWLQIHSLGLAARETTGAASFRDGNLDLMADPANPRPEIAIRFGNTNVTNGWVPLPSVTYDPSGDDLGGAQIVFNKPVYLAPNDRLDVKLRTRLAYTRDPFLFARCSPVLRPDAVRIPVLFGWESSAIDPPVTSMAENVPVGRFYNEFAETIHVERMIGRIGLYTPFYAHRYMTNNVLVALDLHDGTKITRGPTPLASLFDLARQSWVMNFPLPPRGYIQAALSGGISGAGDAFRVYLGMIGYRTIG